MVHDPMHRPNFAVFLGLAWIAVSILLLVQYWAGTVETLLDPDDAMRLVEVRAFLGGQGWFDLHEARLQPPIGYDTHWSRLIDAGLAALFILFNQFTNHELAERLMRTAWPLLWLLPAMSGAAAIAWRLAGREAALVALLLAVMGLPALTQFKPGSIDHHNIQITLAVLATAATVWSDRLRWAAWAAGTVTGLALAIGFECLPYLLLCGAAFVLRYLLSRDGAMALRAYGLSLAAATGAAFLVSVGPAHWTQTACDAIAVNSALAVIAGGLVLSLAGRFGAENSPWARCGVIALAAGVAGALFAWLDPLCLAGPFARVDPALKSMWLVYVHEGQPLFTFARANPVKATALATFPAAALIAVIVLAGDPARRRDFGFLTAGASVILAVATMVAVVKAHYYAMWLGMPVVAAVAPPLFVRLRLQTMAARVGLGLFLTPAALSIGAVTIAQAAGPDPLAEGLPAARYACQLTENYAALARLPPGLVVADIDFGPFLLALTPHSVLAAPYHRLSAGIITANRIFAAPPDESRRILADVHATYLVTCGPQGPLGLGQAAQAASLWSRLRAGAVPGWLEPVALPEGDVFTVYRIKS